MKRIFYKIGYNTLIQILGKAVSTILAFISIGLLTRYLGQEGFGNFSLAFAYFSIFSIIADCGLQITMVRELAKRQNLPKEIYGTYFWIKLFLVIISTILAVFFLLFFPYSKFLKIGIILASIGAAIGVLNTYGTVIFQANLRLDLVTVVDVLTKIVTTAFIVFFVFWKFSFYSILLTILIGNLAGTFSIILLLRRFITCDLDFDFNLAKNLIIRSLPVGLVSVLVFLYFKIDVIILSLYRGPEEIGIYSLAYKILENILMLWGFYIATVYPLLANLLNRRETKEASAVWRRSLFLALGSSGIIIFLGFIFAPLAIRILGGEEFKESIIALRILLFSIPLFFINNLFYHTFLVKEKIKPLFTVVSTSLGVNLIFNLLFIPQWGFIAASIITVVTELYISVCYIFMLWKLRGLIKLYE